MEDTGRTGSIGPLTLPNLIQMLWGDKRTGTLTLRDEEIAKTLHLNEGRVVFASSTDPDDRLGQLFLQHGMITLPVLIQAVQVSQAKKERLGTVLVKMNSIGPKDLTWGVKAQVKGIVLSLFQWTRGSWMFEPGPAATGEVITLNVPTAELIIEGIKNILSWTRIEAAVGGLEAEYRTGPRSDEMSELLDLSDEECTLLSRCERPATLKTICEQSPLADFEVCRLLWTFTVVGLLERPRQAGAMAQGRPL